MKVVLIRPPKIKGTLEKTQSQQPINLAYLASCITEDGYRAEIWDYEVEELSLSSFNRRLSIANPRVVGITCMTPTINNAHMIASLIKKFDPKIKIVVGGPHASALPRRTLLEFENFDILVVGEGEATFREICQRVEAKEGLRGIQGAAYRDNGDVKIEGRRSYIDDLDGLPYPARNLLKRNLYRGAPSVGLSFDYQNKTEVFTSRGCFYRCTFCAISSLFGHRVRFRSAEDVIGEVKQCVNEYGYSHIGFEDTNFTSERKRLHQICRALKKLNLTWNCQTRVDMVDREMLRMMADCGCKKIAYGVESGSPRILNLMRKGTTPPQVVNAFRWAKEFGILTCAFMMLGSHPSETKEDTQMTKRLLKQIQPDVFQLSIAVPYPGSELYNIMKDKNYLEKEDWAKFNFMHSIPSWHIDNFSAADLVKIQKSIYINYILNLKTFLRLLRNLRSSNIFKYYLNISREVIKFIFIEKRN